jgi:hypothetical protein
LRSLIRILQLQLLGHILQADVFLEDGTLAQHFMRMRILNAHTCTATLLVF